jgi:hypothetical protein
MSRKIILLVLIIAIAALALAASALCEFGPRFGPWKYYAPYYFPKRGCMGMCISPRDFVPTYEDPNPLVPGLPTPLPPPRKVHKVTRGGCPPVQRAWVPTGPRQPLPPARPVPPNSPFYSGS